MTHESFILYRSGNVLDLLVGKQVTLVRQEDRQIANGHKGGILWLTGMSGSGKTTLAMALESQLFQLGYQTTVLDGDIVRHGLCSDLGFSSADRSENIRRVGELAVLFARAGMLVVTAFISPYQADRERVRFLAPEFFHEIHIHADLDVCEARDPKGLYKKARANLIPDFTGISAPYEIPVAPELVIATGVLSVEASVARLLEYAGRHF